MAWLTLADSDYVSARTLLLNGMLPQGAMLANTSIEKYLKMIHLIKSTTFKQYGKFSHNITNLYKHLIDNKHSTLAINESFLNLLVTVYESRYFDHLKDGFNFAINRNKLIVGLDESVFRIRTGLYLLGDGPQTAFDKWRSENYPPLITMNHSFGTADRAAAFDGNSQWYEMRVINGTWMSAQYQGSASDDDVYDLSGLQSGSNEREFILQAPPALIPD